MEKIVFVSKSTKRPPCHFSPLFWSARSIPSRSPDRGHERRLSDKEKSCERNSYTENLASEREKITHRPDFFTWMRSTPAACSSLSVQNRGASTGAPAGLDDTPYILLGNSLNLRIPKFHQRGFYEKIISHIFIGTHVCSRLVCQRCTSNTKGSWRSSSGLQG
jgi:hypothetical protein